MYKQVSFRSADESGEFLLVFALDVLQGNDGSGLLVDHCSKTGFALDDDVWDAHLPAESGEEDNELDGVNIVSDDDERGLLGFNEGNTVVQAVFGEEGLLGLFLFLAISGVFGLSVETSFLLLFCLGAVPKVVKLSSHDAKVYDILVK